MGSREDLHATAPTVEAAHADAAPITAPATHGMPARSEPPLGRVGKFLLLEPLGTGGMGVVYEALDKDLARKVAIKLVATHASTVRAQARLLHEAQAQARLSHPNVVAVYEVGSLAEGELFIAMELVRGPTLRAWQAGAPRRWQDVVAMYAAAGAGLAAAHRSGLVHRDFKPDNVLIGEDGRPRVTDFGLAFAVEAARATPDPDSDGDDGDDAPGIAAAGSANLATQPPSNGAGRPTDTAAPTLPAGDAQGTPATPIGGTPGYMAPEHLAGDAVDARADQYAFCVALYEALHGARPAPDAAVSPGDRRYPRWLADLVTRGLASDPSHRFTSMDALLAELTRRPGRPRRRTVIAIAAAAVLVTAGAAFALRAPAPALCPRGTDELAGIWDGSIRQRIAAQATVRGAVDPAWTSTAVALDRYAERWIDAQQAACKATHVDHVQSPELLDRRTDCLEGDRRSLEAAATVLRDRPAQSLAHAGELIGSLGDLARCADTGALLEHAQHRPVIPPGREAQAAELRGQLARARALVTTEDLTAAEPALATAASLAQAIDGQATHAEVDYLTARVQMLRGQLASSVELFERAVERAIADRDDELATEIYLTLAKDAALREFRPAEGQRWLGQAQAWLARVGHTGDARRITVEMARSKLQTIAGDLRGALATASRALADAERLWGATDPRLLPLLEGRANAEAKLGQTQAAVADARRDLELAIQAWGPDHPAVARARRVLGMILIEQLGDVAAGGKELTEALRIFSAHGDRDAYEVAGCEQGLSVAAQFRGDFAGVLAHATRAEQIFARHLGADHPRRAEALNGVAVARFLLRDYAGALADYEAVYPVWRATFGAEHTSVGLLLSNTGEALLALDRLDDAQTDFERALAILHKTVPSDSPYLAYPLKGLGLTQLRRGHTREARDLLEQALTLRIRTGNQPDPADLAEIQWGLARALHAQHQEPARAHELANDARAGFRALGAQLDWRTQEISRGVQNW